MTRPEFSDDPRGGVFIDDGENPIARVEEEQPAPETPSTTTTTEATPEVESDG